MYNEDTGLNLTPQRARCQIPQSIESYLVTLARRFSLRCNKFLPHSYVSFHLPDLKSSPEDCSQIHYPAIELRTGNVVMKSPYSLFQTLEIGVHSPSS